MHVWKRNPRKPQYNAATLEVLPPSTTNYNITRIQLLVSSLESFIRRKPPPTRLLYPGIAHEIHDTRHTHNMEVLDHSPTPAIEEQEPTRDGLIEVVEDLPLVRDPNIVRDERCSRCDRKNDVRLRHDLPLRDETFDDGERVRLLVGYDTDEETTSGWEVTAVYHIDHPMFPKEDAARPGYIQAQVTGTLEKTGWTYEDPLNEGNEHTAEDAGVVRDVEIEWYSPADQGDEREPINEADNEGIADPQATDPYNDWPASENEWRAEVIRELGDEDASEWTADEDPEQLEGVRDPRGKRV